MEWRACIWARMELPEGVRGSVDDNSVSYLSKAGGNDHMEAFCGLWPEKERSCCTAATYDAGDVTFFPSRARP